MKPLLYLFTSIVFIQWSIYVRSHRSENIIEYANGGTILCIGDFLTQGIYLTPDGAWGNTHSYATRLQQLIPNTRIIEKGVARDDTNDMLKRLPGLLQEYSPTVVIILAGTIDVMLTYRSLQIFNNIMELHKLVHNSTQPEHKPAITVGVTMPTATWFDTDADNERRNVNRFIRIFSSRHADKVVLFDLSDNLNFLDNKNNNFSPDGVHLSLTGYDKFAEELFKKLQSSTLGAPLDEF